MTYMVVYGKTFSVVYHKEPLCHLDTVRGVWCASNYDGLDEIQKDCDDCNVVCLEWV